MPSLGSSIKYLPTLARPMIIITGLSSISIQLERAGSRCGRGSPGLASHATYLSIRSELELVFEGSPDWVCCFSCDLANFSAAAMGHPDKLCEVKRERGEETEHEGCARKSSLISDTQNYTKPIRKIFAFKVFLVSIIPVYC